MMHDGKLPSVSMPSRAYTSLLPTALVPVEVLAGICVNALSGLYLIVTK